MDKLAENNIEDYAYYARQFWEENQVGSPKFIIIRSEGISGDIYEIHDTFEEAEESLMCLLNKGYDMTNYSIHHLSFPLPFNNKLIRYLSTEQAKQLLNSINNIEKKYERNIEVVFKDNSPRTAYKIYGTDMLTGNEIVEIISIPIEDKHED